MVAQELEVRDAEDLAAGLELPPSQGHDDALVVAGVARLQAAGRVAELPVGARDEDGAHALIGVAGQDAARADGLVVGMGVHGHEGERSVGHGRQRRGSADRAGRAGSPPSCLQATHCRRPAARARPATPPAAPSGAR